MYELVLLSLQFPPGMKRKEIESNLGYFKHGKRERSHKTMNWSG